MVMTEIKRFFHIGLNPFRIRARYRKFKPEIRSVDMPNGKIFQVKVYPHEFNSRWSPGHSSDDHRPTGLRQVYQISNPRWRLKKRWWRRKARDTALIFKAKLLLTED